MNTLKNKMTAMISLLLVTLGMATATSAHAQYDDRYDRNAQLITGLAIGAVAGYVLLEAHHNHKDRYKHKRKYAKKHHKHHRKQHRHERYTYNHGYHGHDRHCKKRSRCHHRVGHHNHKRDHRSYREGRHDRRVSVSHF